MRYISATLRSVRDIDNFVVVVTAFQQDYVLEHREVDGRYVLFCNGEMIDESGAWDINAVRYELGFRMPDGTAKPAVLTATRSYTWSLRKKVSIRLSFDGKIILDYEGIH